MGIDLPAINLAAGSLPTWGTFLLALAVIIRLWIQNRKLTLDTEGGIRDHYAKEVASLRAQVLALQESATLQAAAAERRYTEAIEAADKRHALCEQECENLRDSLRGLERKYEQLHRSTLKLFQLRDDLHPEVIEHFRSLEQAGIVFFLTPGEAERGEERDQ